MAALRSYQVVDTAPEEAFDELTALAALIYQTPIACISFIDALRQCFKSCHGIRFRDTGRENSFCDHTVRQKEVLVVPDAALDERFARSPLVEGGAMIRFYAGVPLLSSEGHAIGTLCVADTVPRELDTAQTEALRVLGKQVSSRLELRRLSGGLIESAERLSETNAALRASLDRLSEAETMGRSGTWTWEIAADKVMCSDNLRRLLDIDPDVSDYLILNNFAESVLHPEDRTRVMAALRRSALSSVPYDEVYRINRRDGSTRFIHARGESTLGPDGRASSMRGWVQDITERLQLEGDLREKERFIRAAIDGLGAHIAVVDGEGVILSVNEAWRRFAEDHEGGADSLVGGNLLRDCGRGDGGGGFGTNAAAVARGVRDVLRGGRAQFELEYCLGSGENTQWLLLRVTPFPATGPKRVVVARENLTLLKKNQSVLLERERKLALIADNVPGPLAQLDHTLRFRFANAAHERWLGKSMREIEGRTMAEVMEPEACARAMPYAERALAGEHVVFETGIRNAQGGERFGLVHFVPDPSGGDGKAGIIVLITDITDSKRAERELEHHRQELQLILDAVPALIFYKDRAHRLVRVNDGMARLMGLPREAMLGRTDQELGSPYHEQYTREEAEILAKGVPLRGLIEPLQTVSGLRWLQTDKIPYRDRQGKVCGVIGFAIDVTERKANEEALRVSEERFRQIAEHVEDAFWIADPGKGAIHYISPAYGRIWGRSAEDLCRDPGVWMEAMHPGDRERMLAAAPARASGGYDEEFRIVRPDGDVRWIRDRAFPVTDAAGRTTRIVGVARDITGHRLLEDQFRQAQKMEAVGQLASGVAHDFNNILTVIHGNAALLLERDLSPGQLREHAGEILRASESVGGLTRQLLTFSRKQVMRTQSLDLNHTVTRMIRMLERILGADILLRTDLATDLPPVQADAGMLEQALVNLAVNSRDAMPGGGVLTISTAPADTEHPAFPRGAEHTGTPLVALSVRDTGCGIPQEAHARIFEPFYTTKEVGKGTGLGLAAVYGIVAQHRGWIDVESEPGRGTVFQILLPSSPAVPHRENPSAAAPAAALPRGTGTILVAEDEPALRTLVVNLLRRCGYTVVSAASGVEAVKLWRNRREAIDLLLTDLVMPDGMTGRELAITLRSDEPRLRVLYTSGYSEDAAGLALLNDPSSGFLPKPYHPMKLAEAVRSALEFAPGERVA